MVPDHSVRSHGSGSPPPRRVRRDLPSLMQLECISAEGWDSCTRTLHDAPRPASRQSPRNGPTSERAHNSRTLMHSSCI